MDEISKDAISLLTFLLPGFLVAWIFYAFTSYTKPEKFERIVQALIFTLLVNALVAIERIVLEFVGRWYCLRVWDNPGELIALVITALGLGLFVSYLTNSDTIHRRLRLLRLSQRSALPNEWCTVFHGYARFVVLHFKDGRRLLGWPQVWPTDPKKGHIFVTDASWVHGEPEQDLPSIEGILVDIKDIEHIEFIKPLE